jgi:hypothetical protein
VSFILVGLAVAGLTAGPAAALGPTPPTWETRETITKSAEAGEHGGADRILAYDHHGRPGVVYIDGNGEDVRFARRLPAVGWQTQTVDYAGDVGWCPSLAFNEYGTGWPGITYFDHAGNLYYIEDPPAVPEPATLALLAAGAAVLIARRRRRDRRGP